MGFQNQPFYSVIKTIAAAYKNIKNRAISRLSQYLCLKNQVLFTQVTEKFIFTASKIQSLYDGYLSGICL